MASAVATSLILRRELPLRGFDLDVRGALAEQLRARGMDLRPETVVKAIARHGDGVLLDTSAGPLEYDAVLYATGRHPVPNTGSLGLAEQGVDLGADGAVRVDGSYRSSVPSIYAIGDCSDHAGAGLDAGSFDLTPVAIAEGRAIAEALFNDNPQEVCYATIPTAVFSLPEAAAVGLTEEGARAAGHDVLIFRTSFRPLLAYFDGRAGSHDDEARGRSPERSGARLPHGRRRCRRDHAGARDRADRGRDEGAVRRDRRPAPERRRGVRDDVPGHGVSRAPRQARPEDQGKTVMASTWTPASWRAKPVRQMPEYPDAAALATGRGPALALSAAGVRGRGAQPQGQARPRSPPDARSCLQGGDCAESFAEFHADNIRDTLRVFLQMAVVLTYGAAMPVVKVGRMAGQFAKPRSAPTERQGEVELPSYRGDIVNGLEFAEDARIPDPARQIQAYAQAAATLNLLRAFTDGGYAALTRVHSWMLGFVDRSPEGERYRDMADRITEALAFMEACGVDRRRRRRSSSGPRSTPRTRRCCSASSRR